jgi:hypothetical protein
VLLRRSLEERRAARLAGIRTERLRQVLRASSDPRLGFELVPGRRVVIDGIRYSINGLGFRDREREMERGSEVTRVLVLGGGAGFGWGLPQDALIGRQLEAAVNIEGRRDVEVVSACVPGYGPGKAAYLLRERLHLLAPDVVVLLFSVAELPHERGTAGAGTGASAREDAAAAALPSPPAPDAGPCRGIDFAALEQALAQVRAEAQRRGFRVVWALIPYLPDPEEWSCAEPWRRAAEIAAAQGFIVAQLPDALAAPGAARRGLYLSSPWEPSAAAGRLIADQIFRHLVWERVLLSPLEILEKERFGGL